MSSIADYVGRTVDVAMLQDITASGQSQLATQGLVDANGYSYAVTGVQKLIQRFVLIFLTRKGSLQYNPDFGTIFMIQAVQGYWRTTGDVQLAFNAVKLDFMRQIIAAQLATDPLDEQIDDVALLGVSLVGLGAYLSVELSTQAGNTITFIAPIIVTT